MVGKNGKLNDTIEASALWSMLGRRGREVNTIDPNVTVKSHHSDFLQEEKYKHKKEIVSHNFSFLYYV